MLEGHTPSYLMKPFSTYPKKVGQDFKYLKNEKSFLRWNKKNFIIFKWLLVTRNCLGPESASLMWNFNRLWINSYLNQDELYLCSRHGIKRAPAYQTILHMEWLYARNPGTKDLNPKCPALIKCFIQLPGT